MESSWGSTESYLETLVNMPVKLVSNWAMRRLLVTLGKDSYLDLDFQGCQVVVSTPSTLVINLMRLKHQMVRSKLLQVSYHFLKL